MKERERMKERTERKRECKSIIGLGSSGKQRDGQTREDPLIMQEPLTLYNTVSMQI